MIIVMLRLLCSIYWMGKLLGGFIHTYVQLNNHLFCRILQHRWQYFYKSQVLRGFSPGASDQPMSIEDQPEHPRELLAILTAYGEALVQIIDPHITQTVLSSLQCLHERWKLFDRQFFKTHLLASFLEALIKILVSHNGILHHDQLINVLFRMSQSDGNALESKFVALGYVPGSKFIEDIRSAKVRFNFNYIYTIILFTTHLNWKTELKILKNLLSFKQDFPTFSTKIAQFVQDAKCSQSQ